MGSFGGGGSKPQPVVAPIASPAPTASNEQVGKKASGDVLEARKKLNRSTTVLTGVKTDKKIITGIKE